MGPHRQLDYVVRRLPHHWAIEFGGWLTGRFETAEAALKAARADAERVRRHWGHEVRVLLKAADGRAGLVFSTAG
jgi:hypothetical protein